MFDRVLFRRTVLSLIASMVASGSAYAQSLTLGAPFSDNMVFQRGQPIAIWGSATPGESVKVTLGSAESMARANSKGIWQTQLPAMTAQEGLAIKAVSELDSQVVSNVAIGDVFLCSGQSNMEFSLGQSALGDGDRKAPIDARLRLIKVPLAVARTPQRSFSRPATWRTGQVDTASFSAICLLFGREIAREQKVVVGLINASYGGTPIEGWMDRTAMVAAGGMADWVAMIDAFADDPVVAEARYGAQLDGYWTRTNSPWPGRMGFANLHNAMIAPLGTTRFAGVLWYQGENNANGSDTRQAYRAKLRGLFEGWRAQFGAELPFIVMQLAGFGPLAKEPGPSTWAEIREAQRLAVDSDRRAALVVTVDVGERLDIHPPLKKPVALRSAQAARVVVYRKEGGPSGPEAVSARRDGNSVIVRFAHVQDALFAASWGRPGPFQVCEVDARQRCWYADAEFTSDGVRVSTPRGANPNVLRYCWAAAPLCNVFDGAQLPLGPFELAVDEK